MTAAHGSPHIPQQPPSPMKRLFITGGTGYLGSVLIRQALAAGYTVGASHLTQTPPPNPPAVPSQDVPSRPSILWSQLDIRDLQATDAVISAFQPDIIIHTAFLQFGPDVLDVTAKGAEHVAIVAARLGARLIHLSSDVIFDGEKQGAYSEADPPAPISEYGAAKAEAEALVAAANPKAAIVRTSLIYGFNPIDRQTQFALDVAAGKQSAKLFSDEYRCPIYVEDLAAALLELALTEYTGILHIAGAERLSRYEIGTLMAQAYGEQSGNIPAGLSSESSTRRPRNCTLDSSRANELLTTRIRGLREVLIDLDLA